MLSAWRTDGSAGAKNMLTILNEQTAAFRVAQRRQLVRRLAVHARLGHPAEVAVYADPALTERIDEGMCLALLHISGIAALVEAQGGEGACR